MAEGIRMRGGRRSEVDLDPAGRWQLEASLWCGVAIIFWALLAPRASLRDPQVNMFAEWLAVGLATIAVLTVVRVKRQIWRRRRSGRSDPVRTSGSIALADVLRDHGVREFGTMYLYMPKPRRADHEDVWAWLAMLRTRRVIEGRTWHIQVEHAPETMRRSHPNLFEGSPSHFEVYRLNWRLLIEVMDEDSDRPRASIRNSSSSR